MDTALFAQMLSDRHGTNLRKLRAKYPQADIQAFLSWLKSEVYRSVPLQDVRGENLVYLDRAAAVPASAVEALRAPQDCSQAYSLQAMEEEVLSTFAIESIPCSRDSVRRVLAGNVPCNMEEERVAGMQKALGFIADRSHTISEENLFHLYETAIAPFLPDGDKLLPGNRYRHDAVYVVRAQVGHAGIPWDRLPACMASLVAFSNVNDPMDDLSKAALLHFYLAYLHPYFDGNGRMARLLHLWYLVQRGYPSALSLPLSASIRRTRAAYYGAFTLIENNARISGVLDVSPFLVYCGEHVYGQANREAPQEPQAGRTAGTTQ